MRMKAAGALTLLLLFVTIIALAEARKSSSYKFQTYPLSKFQKTQNKPINSNPISQRAKDIVQDMTLPMKIGQMTQIDIITMLNTDGLTLNHTKLYEAIHYYGVGSFLNAPFSGGAVNGIAGWNATQWVQFQIELQTAAMQYSNQSIPIIYGLDSVHGANYIYGAALFPHNLGVAATFNPKWAMVISEIATRDTRAAGTPWNFSPVADLGINPLWSRLYETFGEDPLLVSHMVDHAVKGVQGYPDENLIEYGAACLKHFFAYSDPKSGKDRTPAWISERQLLRYFLPGYVSAMNAGVKSVMINSGSINHIPVHSDHEILTDLLRGRLNFTGTAVTDYQDIEKLNFFHHISPTYLDATHIAIDAGNDMSMVPLDLSFPVDLLQLVNENKISVERINESVERIIQLKIDVGLFDSATFPSLDNPNLSKVGSDADRKISLEVARESITLLKNENNILPLNAKSLNKVLVTGPAGNSLSIQNGGWSIHWQGAEEWEFPYGTTIFQGVQQIAKSINNNVEVVFELGSNLSTPADINAAVEQAKTSDVVILCFGEAPEAEQPGDINDLQIDRSQLDLYRQIREQTSTPIILVLVEARPRIINEAALSDAILMAYLPASEGGQAIAEIIFGVTNPSGKLPLTYPQYPNDVGIPYYKTYSDATYPLYEFGTGLSYTQFTYSSLILSSNVIDLGEELKVSVTVTNSGLIAGQEVVLLYLSDLYASVMPEVKMLKRFEKIYLDPNGSQTLSWTLTMEDLSYIGRENIPVVEAGDFTLSVGGLTASFALQAPVDLSTHTII